MVDRAQRQHRLDRAVRKHQFASGSAGRAHYLSRYTHRVAISNRRLISVDDTKVTFTWKDYRAEGAERYKTMTLPIHEFIRRFLIHVFPKRFHHIRHYGLLANGHRADNVALARQLLVTQDHDPRPDAGADKAVEKTKTCPTCGGRMIIIQIFEPGADLTAYHQRAPPERRITPSRPSR